MMNNIKFKSISKDNYEVLEDIALELNTDDMDEVMDYLIYHWIETDELAQDMGYFPIYTNMNTTKDTDTNINTNTDTNTTTKEKYNGKLPF